MEWLLLEVSFLKVVEVDLFAAALLFNSMNYS
jgi:hypothetical protein